MPQRGQAFAMIWILSVEGLDPLRGGPGRRKLGHQECKHLKGLAGPQVLPVSPLLPGCQEAISSTVRTHYSVRLVTDHEPKQTFLLFKLISPKYLS